MSAFSDLCTDEIMIVDSAGHQAGPLKCVFDRQKVTIFADSLNVEEGNKVLRVLPNGRTEAYTVREVAFTGKFHGLPASYDLHVRKDTSMIPEGGQRTTKVQISHSHSFQVGDYNTQEIVNSLQNLVNAIDSAQASVTEKEQAKHRLREFLSHPLITSILGGASGGLLGLLK